MAEESPGITPILVNKLNFDRMTEYGEYPLLDTTPEINDTDSKTKAYLHHLASITHSLPYHDQPIHL